MGEKIRVKRLLYPEEAERVMMAMLRAGYEVTPSQAEWLWRTHSEEYCASSLGLPADDAEIVRLLEPYFEVEDD